MKPWQLSLFLVTVLCGLEIHEARAFVEIRPSSFAHAPSIAAPPRSLPSVALVSGLDDHRGISDASVTLAHVVSTAVEHSSAASVPLLPVLGSAAIMFTIVGLLFAWEKFIEWVRETIPSPLRPVVESILAEIGGLGFIGLVVQTVKGANEATLEELSVRFFGEADILIETFEYLHSAFFQVAVAFFVASGAMVVVGLKKLDEIQTVEELQMDPVTGACTFTPDKVANYLPVLQVGQETTETPPENNLWKEIMMSTEERAGKTLLLRSRIIELVEDLPDTFRIEKYIKEAFAENLLEIVELSPLTWIYLIPALALANSVDLSHEVVNASSPNAAESAGFFFSTPWAIWPSTLSAGLSLAWGVWNCWKLTQIKYMLVPRLGKNLETGETIILPPPVEIDRARDRFVSTQPSWIDSFEKPWAEPSITHYDELFGKAGAAGPMIYQNSIKFHTWLCITQIVFFGTQIVPRDIDALITGGSVGDPSSLTAEFVTYGMFVLLGLIQLIFLAPRAFWNYCLVTCVGDRALEELANEAARPSNELI